MPPSRLLQTGGYASRETGQRTSTKLLAAANPHTKISNGNTCCCHVRTNSTHPLCPFESQGGSIAAKLEMEEARINSTFCRWNASRRTMPLVGVSQDGLIDESHVRVKEYLREFVHLAPVNDIDQPFIKKHENGDMRCVLCGTSWMRLREMGKHISEVREHTRSFNQLDAMRLEQWDETLISRHRQTDPLAHRVASLGLAKWRWHMSHLLHEFIMSPPSSLIMESRRVKEIRVALAKYLRMEKLSLLELAVWKASVTQDNDGSRQLQERRITSGVQVIIPAILPFLG